MRATRDDLTALAVDVCDTPVQRARTAVDRGVWDIVDRAHGLIGVQLDSGADQAVAEAVIGAALLLRTQAHDRLLDGIRDARGRGTPWQRIATLLGYADTAADGTPPAERAFFLLAPHDDASFEPSSTTWSCSTCRREVTDRGPLSPNPLLNEAGHAEDCRRFTADVQAFRRERRWS